MVVVVVVVVACRMGCQGWLWLAGVRVVGRLKGGVYSRGRSKDGP